MNNIINNIFNGITDRDEIRADVRACMIESLKEYDIFELPEDFESDVDEYTDNIMSAIEAEVQKGESVMKMTRDLLKNAEQVEKDARALHEAGERYDGWGVTNRFVAYFDEHYEFDTVEDDSLFGGEIFTEEQKEVYNEYTAAVRRELRQLSS